MGVEDGKKKKTGRRVMNDLRRGEKGVNPQTLIRKVRGL